MRYLILPLLFLGLCAQSRAQSSTATIQLFATDPSGSCPPRRLGLSIASGGFFYCSAATNMWTAVASGSVSAYNLIQDEGSSLTARTTANFAGAGVTCADGSGKTTCTIPGASAGFTNFPFTSQTSVTMTHNFGTKNIIVQCFDASDVNIEWDTLTTTSTSAATVTFASAQTGSCNVNSSSGGSSSGSVTITGTGTINFSSAIPDGASSIGGTTITVTGANVGDPVVVGPSTNLAAKVTSAGKVTASNTVTVEVFNNSGIAVTPGSATWTAQVFH